MSQAGLTWAYGEVVDIQHAFKNTTASEGKKKQGGAGDEAMDNVRGEVTIQLQGNQAGAGSGPGKQVTAYPADINTTRIPLVGEHVVCFQGPGPEMGAASPDASTGKKASGMQYDLDWYYLAPVSLGGSIHTNLNPASNSKSVKSPTRVLQDGNKTNKVDAYANAEAGNPTTSNKKQDAKEGVPAEEPPTTDQLSSKMIAKFQKLEEAVIEYKQAMDAGDTRKTEEGLKDRESKIDEYKERLVREGFTGEFKESEEKFGYNTITGYLELSTLAADNYDFNNLPVGKGGTYQSVLELHEYDRGYENNSFYTKEESTKFVEQFKEPTERKPEADQNYSPNPKDSNPASGPNPNTSDNKTNPPPGNDFVEQTELNNLQPYEGDILIQGRFGNSIRFGSTVNPKEPERYIKMPSWSEGQAGPGAPINILRAGQAPSQKNSRNEYIIEDINGDKASIYMCSGQKIAVSLAHNQFDAIEQPFSNSSDEAHYSSNGYAIPSKDCNGISAPIFPAEPLEPIPDNVEELELLDGEYEYFDTERGSPTRGRVVGTDRIRLIQGQPVLEKMCGKVLTLFKAAKADGVEIKLNSSFRGLWQINHPRTGKKLASGQVNCRYANAINKSWKTEANKKDRSSPLWTASSTKFSCYVAIPGYSRHQSGTAIDLDYKRYLINKDGSRSKTSTSNTKGVYAWLVANSYKYGFVRTVTTEEWHFEYNTALASKGPFSKLRAGKSSNSWHGLDAAFEQGRLGPWPGQS